MTQARSSVVLRMSGDMVLRTPWVTRSAISSSFLSHSWAASQWPSRRGSSSPHPRHARHCPAALSRPPASVQCCVVKSAYSSNVRESLAAGVAMGTVMVLLFCGYSLGICYDAKLILEKGYTYTRAQVMNVIFVMLTGLLALGQASPSMKEFAGGQAAVYKILEAINREPKIDTYSTTVSHANVVVHHCGQRRVFCCRCMSQKSQDMYNLSLQFSRPCLKTKLDITSQGKNCYGGAYEKLRFTYLLFRLLLGRSERKKVELFFLW